MPQSKSYDKQPPIILPAHLLQEQLRKVKTLRTNPEWWSNPANQELTRQLIDRATEPYYKFRPYYNRRDGKAGWQWNFLAKAADYKGRIALSANQCGKTTLGAYEAALAVTGQHPCKKFPAEGKGWIVGIDNQRMERLDIPMFKEMLPNRYKGPDSWKRQDKLQICEADGRHWEVQFKSGEMDVTKFMGEQVDFIWFDEEIKHNFPEIYTECMMRLAKRRGLWWMTATPILGTAFLKELSERDDVYPITASLWDNPYVPEEEIQKLADQYTQEERDVRIEGKYIIFGGRPVFNIRLLNKWIDGLKDDLPISVGVLDQVA